MQEIQEKRKAKETFFEKKENNRKKKKIKHMKAEPPSNGPFLTPSLAHRGSRIEFSQQGNRQFYNRNFSTMFSVLSVQKRNGKMRKMKKVKVRNVRRFPGFTVVVVILSTKTWTSSMLVLGMCLFPEENQQPILKSHRFS